MGSFFTIYGVIMTSFKFSKLAQHISQRYIAQRYISQKHITKKHLGSIKTGCVLSALALAPHVVMAQAPEVLIQTTEAVHSFSIQSGSLASALTAFSRQSGITVSFLPNTVRGLTSKVLTGKYNSSNALNVLLKKTGLTAIKQSNGSYVIKKSNDSAANTAENSNVVGTLALTTVGNKSRFGDAPQEQDGFKAEYQSTTSKMAMKIIDTPQAISAVTRDALDARQVKTVATAVELTPSINSNVSAPGLFGGYGRKSNSFTIRGLKADIRIDGMLSPSVYDDDDGIDMAAFERIEVVRGPAGFYGSGSLGGFINKVRKKPQAEFGAHLSVQAGSYNTYRAEGGITGSINDNESLRGRVDFAYENADAFTDHIESERLFIAPSFEAVISDNTRILLQLTYQKDEFDDNPGIQTQYVGDKVELIEQFSSTTELYGSIGDKSSKENTTASLTINHELSEHWLASLYLQGHKKLFDHINGNYASIYSGYVYSANGKENTETDTWAGELRLQGSFETFGREHQVLLGIETNSSNSERGRGSGYSYISSLADYEGNIDDFPSIPASEILIDAQYDHSIRNQALYGQILFSVFDQTKLLMATRYDVAKQHFSVNNSSTSDTEDNAWTSRLGIIQTINDNINAYAMYGQSFKPTTSIGRNGPLEPETGEAYELGLKTEWFNNLLAVNLSVYQQELDNRALTDPTNGRDENFSISSGKHLTKGIELEINGSFYPGWTIGGAASLMDNEYTEKGDLEYGLSNNGSADQQASLYSNYEIQQGKFKGLGIGATFVYVGDQNYLYFDTEPYRQVYLDAYNRLDLNISYHGFTNWDVNLLVHNVTDEKYLSDAAYYGQAYWVAPRSVLLQATYNFD